MATFRDLLSAAKAEIVEVSTEGAAEHIAEPHKMPSDLQRKTGCAIGKDYPAGIVEDGSA